MLHVDPNASRSLRISEALISPQVIFPADRNGVVGLKPTVGLTSRRGIIPESESLDTAGTFGRTVEDAAIALDAIAGIDCKSRNGHLFGFLRC
jgi:Asp-tRNA(Asn)/Glu-tRNA(Gln) amidotransferase A subunit family amidase